jgi:hypothetical protein
LPLQGGLARHLKPAKLTIFFCFFLTTETAENTKKKLLLAYMDEKGGLKKFNLLLTSQRERVSILVVEKDFAGKVYFSKKNLLRTPSRQKLQCKSVLISV